MHQVPLAVAVIVDGEVEIVGRDELHLPDLAGPRAFHVAGREIAAVENFQRREELGAELVRPAAIVGERRQRLQRAEIAEIGAEIRLQSPEADDDRAGHAELLLDARESVGVLLEQALALLHPVVGHHAAGEFEKALREDALAAVGVDDLLVVADAVERGERAGGDALRRGLLLEGSRARPKSRRRCRRTRPRLRGRCRQTRPTAQLRRILLRAKRIRHRLREVAAQSADQAGAVKARQRGRASLVRWTPASRPRSCC